MIADFSEPAFAQLANVLEYERELLLSGRAAEVASLIEEKMDALQAFEARLEQMDLTVAAAPIRRAIEQIIQMAEENSVYMEAIRNGIRHAIRRLEAINTSSQVGSYGRGGVQLAFTNATGVFNRKA
jgi:hypothetical protein